jgi:hypothetical protein
LSAVARMPLGPAHARVVRGAFLFCCGAVGKFEEFEVVDAAKENAELGEMSDEEKDAAEAAKESLKATTEYLKTVLGSRVDKVAVSTRLTSSPSALVQPQWGMSPQMQRFMKAQAAATGQDESMMGGMASNLEINPAHEVVSKLKSMIGAPTHARRAEPHSCCVCCTAEQRSEPPLLSVLRCCLRPLLPSSLAFIASPASTRIHRCRSCAYRRGGHADQRRGVCLR